MAIPVDRLAEVTAARCTSCLGCVDACPKSRGASRTLRWGPPRLLGRGWSQAALVAILLACTTGAVAASYLFPMPSFVKSRGLAPGRVATMELEVENLSCRGRANLFFYFLERDDLFELPGYLKVEAWPGPGLADVRITFDPAKTDEQAIRQAVTEPYYDVGADFWRTSPFRIEGYDPLMIGPGAGIDASLPFE